jgi:tetratricopeptide (TPR) repeat protein
MRISWLTAEEIAAARAALRAGGKHWDDHFAPYFVAPEGVDAAIAEHVARAERVSEVIRDAGLEAARARFGETTAAIEAATLAAAAHEVGELAFGDVTAVFACPIDPYVFYAPFLELLVELGRDAEERVVATYERFVDAYASALAVVPQSGARIGAARDGLADFYVRVGRLDQAQTLFEQRHDEDQNDVAVALSASRAFLAAGSVSHAVRWLGVGAARAAGLGRDELATRLRDKQDAVRKRLS